MRIHSFKLVVLLLLSNTYSTYIRQQVAEPTELGQEKQSRRGGPRGQGAAVHVRKVQPGPGRVGHGRRVPGRDPGRDTTGRESEVVLLAALAGQGQAGSGGALLAAAAPPTAAHHHHQRRPSPGTDLM